jgi:WD40 repeat protein
VVGVPGHRGRRALLASASEDRTVRIWDPATHEQVETLGGNQGKVWSVCPVIVDSQDLLASGGSDGTVRIWDPATGEQVTTLKRPVPCQNSLMAADLAFHAR